MTTTRRSALGWSVVTFIFFIFPLITGQGGQSSPLPEAIATPIPPSTLLEDFLIPDLELADLQSGLPIGTQLLREGVVVLAFLAAECSSCADVFQTLRIRSWLGAPRASEQQVAYVIVTPEDSEAFGALAQQVLEEAPPTEVVASDPFDVLFDADHALTDLFRVSQVPTLFLLSGGQVMKRIDEPAPSIGDEVLLFEEIEQWVDQLLEGTLAPAGPPLPVAAGQPLPAFEAQTQEGELVSLADLEKPALLSFLSVVDCGPSRRLLADLTALQLEQPSTLHIYLIALDAPEGLAQFTNGEGVALPTLLDPQLRLAEQFGITGTPTSLLLDREGVIRWIQVGWHRNFAKLVTKLIREL